jgi:ribonuclease P protein component
MGPTVRKRFPRNGRLLRHADFERVYKQGKRHFAANMTVFYLERESPGNFRVGFTVSRALGGAVVRNRMRRRLREAVRLLGRNSEIVVDVVINPKKSLLTAEFTQIQQEVKRAFELIERKYGNMPGRDLGKDEVGSR